MKEITDAVTFALDQSPSVALMVRASHWQSEGYGFDSRQGDSELILRLGLIRSLIQNYNTLTRV